MTLKEKLILYCDHQYMNREDKEETFDIILDKQGYKGLETLEEIFNIIDDEKCRYATEESEFWRHYKIGVFDGIKYQKEISYSDMQEYATFCIECDRKEMPLLLVQDWYEHYKK